ncbi:MAG: SCO family protein [Rhodothermales bacterium]|nr:SCO family protein [Rhodothermales bacterium]
MRLRLLIPLLFGMSVPALAQPTGSLPPAFDGIGIEERLGEEIPGDLVFRDATGKEVTIGSYFDGETPVMLNFVYHECPMLCSLMLTEFTKTLIDLNQDEGWMPGREFDVVTVSFSGTEIPDQAARAKEKHLTQLGVEDAGDGWHFLTGSDENIRLLSEAMGFSFKWIEDSQEYAHPAAVMFLSGAGVITQYIHGMAYDTRMVRLATVEASQGKVGSAADKIFLFCYRYDPEANSYVADAWNLMRGGGLLTLLLLGGTLFLYWRRERRTLMPSMST